MSLANGLMRRLFYGSQMCVKDEESDMEMSSFDNEVNNMHIEEPPRVVIEKIKHMGTLPIQEDLVYENIATVIKNMKEYPTHLGMQRVCCHTISNMSMDITVATRVVLDNNAHILVVNCLKNFIDDWKICWFGCSAIWNMSRSDTTRENFNYDIVSLLTRMLDLHGDKYQVVNTVIGSLSNLSLNQQFKLYIGNVKTMATILSISRKYTMSNTVSATTAGLIANLAVNDGAAHTLVQLGVIDIIKTMLNNNRDTVLERNVASALNNCISSPLFIRELIQFKLTENLLELRENSSDSASIALASNCLNVLGINDQYWNTSYHLAVEYGHLDILQSIMEETVDLNTRNGNNFTVLESAIQSNHLHMIPFLVKCGINVHCIQFSKSQLSPECIQIIESSVQQLTYILELYHRVMYNQLSCVLI